MSLNDDLDKIMLGKSFDDFLPPVPKIENTIRQFTQRLLSPSPEHSCLLGYSDTQGEVELYDEERGNLFLLGAPRQGKSKFIELLLRHGIDNGFGGCLLDPSEGGETMHKVLAYACKKGYEKVVIIDPHDIDEEFSGIVPTINPIHYGASAEVVAAALSDVLRVAWNQQSFSGTPRIEKSLPAVISAIHAARMTLAELKYFTDRTKWSWERQQILSRLPYNDENRTFLESAISNVREWGGFLPTINRLLPLLDPSLELMLGSNRYREVNGKRKSTQINFQRLIAEKYLLLVNLDPTGIWDIDQQAIVGTLILSQIQAAIGRLKRPRPDKNPWFGKYYVYIDECALFAAPKFANFLYYKPKTGLTFTFAAHSFDQFPDKSISSALRNASSLKGLFWVGNDSDSNTMLKDLGYGGQLSDRDVNFALRRLKKQECAFRNGKQEPYFFRLRDIPDIDIEPKVLYDFKKTIYAREEFYRTTAEVRAEIDNRFAQKKKAPPPTSYPAPVKLRGSQHDAKEKSHSASPRKEPDGDQGTVGENLPVRPDGAAIKALLSQRRERRKREPKA